MEQLSGSQSGKEYIKAVYSHCLTNKRYADNTTLMAERRGIKEPVDEGERGQ